MSVAANKRIKGLVNAVKRSEIVDAVCNNCNDVGDVGRARDYVTNIGLLWRELLSPSAAYCKFFDYYSRRCFEYLVGHSSVDFYLLPACLQNRSSDNLVSSTISLCTGPSATPSFMTLKQANMS